jgi:hypothetical protein
MLNLSLYCKGKCIMELYEIGIVMVLWFFSIIIFYSMGVNSGYIEGRTAVREYYDKREKVRS